MPAIAIPAAIGLGGTIINAITGHKAATSASNIQSEAANQAAQASLAAGQTASTGVNEAAQRATAGVNQAAQTAIGQAQQGTAQGNATLTETLGRQRQNLDPYLAAGQQGLQGLTNLGQNPQDFKFDINDFRNDPSYDQVLLDTNKAIERSAAIKGVRGGGELKAIVANTVARQNQAYGDVYRRSENTFRQNQEGRFRTLSALTGVGQTATGQLNAAEQNAGNQIAGNQVDLGRLTGSYTTDAAGRVANIDTNAALQTGNFLTGSTRDANDARLQGANARASGVLGRANAIGGLVSGVTNIGQQAASTYYGNRQQRQPVRI